MTTAARGAEVRRAATTLGRRVARSDARHLIAPAVGTGALMALYLLTRPYGDAVGSETLEAAGAFASPWWIVAHVAGLLALASYSRLALRFADLHPGLTSSLSRTLGLAGVVLVLPYYGAETFALHVIGRQALAGDNSALGLVEQIRNQPVAMAMFGVGLVLLAGSAVLLAVAWQRSDRTPSWGAWPLALGVALFLPQFFLPPAGRMAFGVAYALAAVVVVASAARSPRPSVPA